MVFTSCEQQVKSREYEEITVSPPSGPHDFMRGAPFTNAHGSDLPASMQLPAGENNEQMQDMLDASVARPSLTWQAPRSWTEEKGSGMRLVTFYAQNKQIECSIISLGGQAGGLQSNVTRWMGQINLDIPVDDQFNAFLSRQKEVKTKSGFSMTVIDLAELSQQEQAPSMIAAIAVLKDKTIFVKMTGNRDSIVAHRNQFISLIKSLELQ